MRARNLNGQLNIIGPNLMKYRKEKNLSLRGLSNKLSLLGITLYHSDIYDIEQQTRTIKDFELKALCVALDISLDQLFEGTNNYFKF